MPGERKHSWRSSRIQQLWTNVSPGGQKYFTRVGHRLANPSHSLPQHINVVRSAVRIIAGHYTFQVRLGSTVFGQTNMTRENATCADHFQVSLSKVTKEQFCVSMTTVYGLRC